MAYKNPTRNCVGNFPDTANRFLSCIYISPCTIAINKEGRSHQHLTRAASHDAPFRIRLIFYNFLLLLVFIKSDPDAAASSPLLGISSHDLPQGHSSSAAYVSNGGTQGLVHSTHGGEPTLLALTLLRCYLRWLPT